MYQRWCFGLGSVTASTSCPVPMSDSSAITSQSRAFAFWWIGSVPVTTTMIHTLVPKIVLPCVYPYDHCLVHRCAKTFIYVSSSAFSDPPQGYRGWESPMHPYRCMGSWCRGRQTQLPLCIDSVSVMYGYNSMVMTNIRYICILTRICILSSLSIQLVSPLTTSSLASASPPRRDSTSSPLSKRRWSTKHSLYYETVRQEGG